MSQFRNVGGFGGFSFFPPVIKYLLLINAGIYVFQYFILGILSFDGINLFSLSMKYLALQPIDANILSFDGGANFYPWQLITYQFLHGSFFHLFFNLFALWMFGVEMENRWGSSKFLTYYLLSGIGAGVIHMIVSPFFGGMGPTVGASGSIYGILLAFGLTFPNRPIFMVPFFIPIPAKYFVLIFAVFEFISGFGGGDGIAHFAHLGGALTGFILLKKGDEWGVYALFDRLFSGFINKDSTDTQKNFRQYQQQQQFRQKRTTTSQKPTDSGKYFVNWEKPKKDYKQNDTNRANTSSGNEKIFIIDGEEINQSRIDGILDKISESGYQNLTDKEKYILTELSKKL